MFLDAEGEPSTQTLESMRGPAYILTLNGMTSFSVGDFGVWPGTSQDFQDNSLGTVDPTRAIQIVNNYILAFFDQYLKGEDQALLQGSSDDYSEVAIESRNVED